MVVQVYSAKQYSPFGFHVTLEAATAQWSARRNPAVHISTRQEEGPFLVRYTPNLERTHSDLLVQCLVPRIRISRAPSNADPYGFGS